ncbi:MAG: DNA mismatch repair protein MutS, partial [Algoriella sp.]
MQISEQTLKDLEFNAVQKEIAAFAYTEKVEKSIFQLKPYENQQLLVEDLQTTNEILSSIEGGNQFPFSEYYILDENLGRLEIENYYLPAEEFFKIKANTLQVKEILKYLTAFKEYSPSLFQKGESIVYEKNIVKLIDQVFNKFGEIKDDASPELKIVRDRLRHLNGRITELFNKSMAYHADNLDDIKFKNIINNLNEE